MKILCLHGMGGNARIFEAQTSQITRLLEQDGHEFVFVDGTEQCEPPGELKAIYPPPYLAYVTINREAEIRAAFDYIDNVLEDEGPFDGVLAFSQGCQLAACMIFERQMLGDEDPLFRWAAFIGSPMPPCVGAQPACERRLAIPALHVIGRKDEYAAESRKLAAMHMNTLDSLVIEHGEGHNVPRDLGVNHAIANAIQKLISMASVAAY